jgi:hypothetical protein
MELGGRWGISYRKNKINATLHREAAPHHPLVF